MSELRDDLLNKCKKHFNEIGLFGDTDICRLIGFGEDEEDFYYKVMRPIGEITYASAVGPWESLKGFYPRYVQLESQFSGVWDCPSQPEFTHDWIGEKR